MNFKYATVPIALILIAVSAISVTSLQQTAFAQNSGMAFTAMAADGSDTIMINGQTMSQQGDITLTVISPNGSNVVEVRQMQPDMNGNFDAVLKIGELWRNDGLYTIMASQGQSSLYNLKVLVKVTDGIIEETNATESSLKSGIMSQMEPKEEMEMGLSINADAMVGSTTISITGMTDKTNKDVTVVVKAPNENITDVYQVTPERDGSFAIDINTKGPLWKQDGDYVVSVQQSENPKYMDSVIVEIKDGVIVPEFGTIAVMILVVAIVSIIAISARSRLSIMPRY